MASDNILDAAAIWLVPGHEHPALNRYSDFFNSLFRMFFALDYRAAYLEAGPAALERRILSALETSSPQLLIYSQFPASYAYLDPGFIAGLRARCHVVGMGWDDEIYFDQAKYFYQACSAVITTDLSGAGWLKQAGIQAHVVVTAWLTHPGRTGLSEDIPVSFVGDMTKPGRREFIDHLEARGIAVADYGIGSRNGPLPPPGVADIFVRSKINLNFTGTNAPAWVVRNNPRCAQAKQIKGRPFELAAMGRFCLSEWVPYMERWFRPGEDIGVFHDPDDLVAQVRRYLADDRLRGEMAASARERYRVELAPEVQFAGVFSKILAQSRQPSRPLPEPALNGAMFYESMGRSRGAAFLHALHCGLPIRALREIFMKWSWQFAYWRGFAEAVVDTIAGQLRRP